MKRNILILIIISHTITTLSMEVGNQNTAQSAPAVAISQSMSPTLPSTPKTPKSIPSTPREHATLLLMRHTSSGNLKNLYDDADHPIKSPTTSPNNTVRQTSITQSSDKASE